ncbi:hypothetical protein HY493_01125 [Candidatus Woesearchaeota archaeon]|nr:hypothetical protein [Candidatus Woesearchaeota archaeon]
MDEQALTRHDRIRIQQEQRNSERDAALKDKESRAKRRRRMIYLISGSVLMLVLVLIGISFAMPGKLDDFAKCLSEKGAVMYGAIEWCKYTKEQAGMFGKSFKYVDYRDYRDGPDVKVTPTWVIGDATYEKVQSLERLSALTGCPL